MATERILKRDYFGTVRLESAEVVTRDTSGVRWWLRWLARALARREAAALEHLGERLGEQRGLPRLLAFDGARVVRSYVPGKVMFVGRPVTRAYFRVALRLVLRMHRCGVAHNDLAKEANWLCLPDGGAGIVDFQVASIFARRTKLFRTLAREDLRHLYKHKRYYLPAAMTARQLQLLATPSAATRCWRAVGKPLYHCVTRWLLGWPERSGPKEREHLYD
jgi:RIO-like serine/threonine protein kinase